MPIEKGYKGDERPFVGLWSNAKGALLDERHAPPTNREMKFGLSWPCSYRDVLPRGGDATTVGNGGPPRGEESRIRKEGGWEKRGKGMKPKRSKGKIRRKGSEVEGGKKNKKKRKRNVPQTNLSEEK